MKIHTHTHAYIVYTYICNIYIYIYNSIIYILYSRVFTINYDGELPYRARKWQVPTYIFYTLENNKITIINVDTPDKSHICAEIYFIYIINNLKCRAKYEKKQKS